MERSQTTIDTPRIVSPYSLMQEEFRDEPWKLLVGCMMLNQTSARQARPVWNEFFDVWPTPEKLWLDDGRQTDEIIEHMVSIVRPLGFQSRRSLGIWKMTFDYLVIRPDVHPSDVMKLHGIGEYAAASFKIFVEGKIVIDVRDKELKNYVAWAISREKESREDVQQGPA